MWAVHKGQRPPLLEYIKPEINNLMEVCWHKNPGNRPDMTEVVRQMTDYCSYYPGGDEPIENLSEYYDDDCDEDEDEDYDEIDRHLNENNIEYNADSNRIMHLPQPPPNMQPLQVDVEPVSYW